MKIKLRQINNKNDNFYNNIYLTKLSSILQRSRNTKHSYPKYKSSLQILVQAILYDNRFEGCYQKHSKP